MDDVHIQPRTERPIENQMLVGGPKLDSGSKPLRVLVDLVLVPVTILDGMNRLVRGLGRDNFQVFEGKHPQDIRYFSSEDAPVSLGIILDVSGSMSDKIHRAREAVLDFLNTANPQDEFFMITFADKPEQAADFTEQVEDIQAKLIYAMPRGRTSLLDAIYLGISKMRQAKHSRKALLIISDGGDNHSRYTESEIVSQVKEADVMIYGIGLYDRRFPTPEEFLGPELLRKVSEVTGGCSFTIDTLMIWHKWRRQWASCCVTNIYLVTVPILSVETENGTKSRSNGSSRRRSSFPRSAYTPKPAITPPPNSCRTSPDRDFSLQCPLKLGTGIT